MQYDGIDGSKRLSFLPRLSRDRGKKSVAGTSSMIFPGKHFSRQNRLKAMRSASRFIVRRSSTSLITERKGSSSCVRDSGWLQTRWAFEESRHGQAFREYLIRSGLRSETEVEALEASVFANAWTLPFETSRKMACYGALQEGATYTAYKLQKEKARCAGDSALEAIFHLVGRDEAAHGGFYRAMIQLELAQDRRATTADLADVLSCFKMPGDGLIANYQQRLRTSGAGISARAFIERVVGPLLITLQISRQEFKQALKTRAMGTPKHPASSDASGSSCGRPALRSVQA